MIDKRKFYINGDWVDPVNKNDFNVIDPSTEEPYVTISLGGADDTNKACLLYTSDAADDW